MRWNRDELSAVAILVATWLIFFSRTLFAGQVYFFDDLKIIFYPLEHVYGEFQRAWQLPIWSPLFGFGQPLLAWGQLGFFTPLHVLLRFLNLHPLWLLQASIVIHYGWGLAGMYLWLRQHKLTSAAAGMGAILFAFSGFHVGHLNHVNFFTATMWLPWLLLALDACLARPSWRRATLVTLAAAGGALGGQPQVVLYTLMVALMYGLIRWASLRHWRPMLASGLRLVVAGVLFGGLASFAILPLLEFLPLTERNDALFEGELFEFSYPPWHAITLVFPTAFGDQAAYWGAKNFQELAAFVGIIPLFLAGAALTNWREHRSLRGVAAWLVLISIFFALGRYSPLYTYLVKEKIITSLAVPGRFIFFFTVGMSWLAALGLHDLFSPPSAHRRRWSYMAGVALPLVLLTPFFFYVQSDIKTIEWLVVIGGILTMGVALLMRRPAMVVAASALTLIVYGWNYNPLVPAQAAFHPSPFAPALEEYQNASGLPARLYAVDQPLLATNHKPRPRAKQENPADNSSALLVRHLQATVGASSARWIGALSIQPYRDFIEVFLANDREPYDGDGLHAMTRFRNMLNLAGVTHILESVPPGVMGDLETQGYQLVETAASGDTSLRLFSNPDAFPKVFFVPRAIFMAAADEVRYHMQSPTFDPRQLAYVNAGSPPSLPELGQSLKATARLRRYEASRVDVATQADRPAVLVLTDTATPTWQVFIDDVPATALTADTLFRAALVPAGEHVVSWRYQSAAITQAKWLTSISLVITLLLLILPTQKLGLFFRSRLARAHTKSQAHG